VIVISFGVFWFGWESRP